MQIRKILVHTDASTGSAIALKAAKTIAENFKAQLTGFFVMPDVAIAAAMPAEAVASPQLVDDMQKHAEERAGAAEAIFRDGAGEFAAPEGWILADGMGIGSRAAAADVSHYADLIVFPRANDDDEEQRTSATLPQDLVVDSGRPIMVIPPSYDGDPIGRNVVVAWTDSREATRAVYDALPFLTQAQQVRIVTVGDEDSDGTGPGQRLADRLKDYDITASVTVDVIANESGKSTSETLFSYAKKMDADLIVAGAYSHSRLREGLFGGVTKSIFESVPIPALLSH